MTKIRKPGIAGCYGELLGSRAWHELGGLREATATGELLATYCPELLRIVSWRLASIKPDPADVEDIASAVIVHMVRKIRERRPSSAECRSASWSPRRTDEGH